jgi:hypothetical protein
VLSTGLPFDALGMLLAAEQLRRAADAPLVVALIADRHALSNGFPSQLVEARACAVQRELNTVRAALGLPLQVVRAESLHRTCSHREIVERVEDRAGQAHPYFKLEVADTECLRREHHAIVKLGWALDGRLEAPHDVLDERLFDLHFRKWIGADVGFAYVRPGRTLDMKRPLAAPYLALDAGRRLLLSPNELGDEKLERFLAQATRQARAAVLGHLRRITRVYDRAIAPLDGPVAERVRAVLDHIYGASLAAGRNA